MMNMGHEIVARSLLGFDRQDTLSLGFGYHLQDEFGAMFGHEQHGAVRNGGVRSKQDY